MLEIIEVNSTPILISLALFNVLVFFLCIIALAKIWRLKRKNKVLFSGKDAKSLESIILKQAEDIKDIDKEIQDLFEISNKINSLALRSLHKIGVVRFNPFKDIGGDQSFAIALLDSKNSGFILSSLHTREGTRVYTKPVINGDSKKYPLTEEERQAIKIASPIKEGKI